MLSKKITLYLSFACLSFSLISCSSRSDSETADAIILQNPPTVLSSYGEDLKIDEDGILLIKYKDDSRASTLVTIDMIDQTNFDKYSIYEQTLEVKYQDLKAPFTFTLSRDIENILLGKAPTITSKCAEPLAIGNDGFVTVNFKDGGSENITITLDMIDLNSINLMSEEKQVATVSYNGYSTTFEFTLDLGYEEDLSGDINEYLLEAEYAEVKEGAYAGVETCTGQTRIDGSQEMCVKGLFQSEEGGWVRWTINSDKNTQAELTFQISLQTNFDGDLDKYSTLLINDCRVKTDIEVLGNNSGWWDWVDRKVNTKIHLKEGVNYIDFKTNEISGMDITTCGGLNINRLKVATNANITWEPNLDVNPSAPQA